MSRTVPEWIAKHDDQAIPPRTKLRIWLRCDGRCQDCSRIMFGNKFPQFDHIKALINGGEHREKNLQLLCMICHAVKTKNDTAIKSKTARISKKHFGIKKRTSFVGWRKFNGEIVRAK